MGRTVQIIKQSISQNDMLCFRNQAQFSPLEFVKHIASHLEIREHTKVLKISKNRVVTHDKVLTADKIVVATHYPWWRL